MEYDPIKFRLARWLGRSGVMRRMFHIALEWLFLRAWYVRRELRRVTRQLPDGPVILDCGMGFGQFTDRMIRLCQPSKLVGLEVKRNYFYGGEFYFRRIKAVKFLLGDAQRLPLAAGSCDLILTVDVMEHIPDDRAALGEFARALRTGGRLIIHIPRLQDEDELIEGERFNPAECQVGEHVRAGYRDRDARERLTMAGFEVERIVRGYGALGRAAWWLLQGVPLRLIALSRLSTPLVAGWLTVVLIPAMLLMAGDFLIGDHPRGGSLLVTAVKRQ